MNNNKISQIANEIKKENSFFSPLRKYQNVLKIDLEKGKSENINIYPNSNPEELAYNFCLKHNLNFKAVKDLISKIKKHKESYSLSNKENLYLSTNIINNNRYFNSKNCSIISKKNKSNKNKTSNNINTFTNFSNKTINEIGKIKINKENKENKENKTISNNTINCNSITPINYDSIYSNNLDSNTSDKNLDIFNFLSPTTNDNKEKISNYNSYKIKTNNELNTKFEYNKTDINNSSNNSILTCNFNDSINDKINNLEKAYATFNPDNRKTEKRSNFNENDENTKEIISKAIQNCLNIVENEDIIDSNNLTVSESNNNSNDKKDLEIKNKKIIEETNEPDNSENIQDNINFKDNDKKCFNNNSFITPKEKKSFNDIETNNLNNDENNTKINNISSDFNKNNNDEINNNKIEINNKFDENEEEKAQMENNENKNKLSINNISNSITKMPERKSNNNYNNESKINDNNNSNKGTIDNIIENQINFSLLSNKNNMTIFSSHKKNSYKRNFKRILPKNSAFCRSYREKGKNLENIGNSNSIKEYKNLKCNSIYCGGVNKDSIISENHMNNIKNFSSIKTKAAVNDNDKNIFSPLTINKSFNKCCLFSFTRSEKNMINLMNKNNDRATITSLGNSTNNNSIITRGSTNLKIKSNKNLIISNSLNKTPINNISHIFNLSNKFLFQRQKEKEKENIYYNNTINNSHSLYYAKYIKNNKNKRLVFSKYLNLNNNTLSNNSNRSYDYLKSKSNSILKARYKKLNNYITDHMKKNYCGYKLRKNNLTQNLMNKNEIMNSLKNIFNFITKNKFILDVFGVVNIQNIPEDIYGIVKTIVKNCDQKKRFIDYNEFMDKAYDLIDIFTKEEKIIILNFNKIKM